MAIRKPTKAAGATGKEFAVSGAAQGRGQEPRRAHFDAVPLGACLRARLTCFIIRFLKRPLTALTDTLSFDLAKLDDILSFDLVTLDDIIGVPFDPLIP